MSLHERNWEQDYANGRFDFLDQPHEQLRHAVISCLIARHAPGEVIDLGWGSFLTASGATAGYFASKLARRP